MQRRAEINEAIGRKYPEQVVLVTTRSRAGKPNVMAVGWVCIVSSEPWMFALGIDDEALTYALIRKTREFVVAFPNERQAKETLYVGTHHGHKPFDRLRAPSTVEGLDKFAACGLKTQDAAVVKAPLVRDAVANFECRLVEITRPGDCPLIVGKVVAAHVNAKKSLRRLYTVGKGYRLSGVRPRR